MLDFLKNKIGFKKLLAFSLAEMLISLTVISLVVSAFAPVMTRKPTSKLIIENIVTNVCAEHCAWCAGKRCVSCEEGYIRKENKCFTCADLFPKSGQHDPNNILSCSVNKITRCKLGYYIKDDNKCLSCQKGKYCNGIEMTECNQGTYQDEAGKPACKVCEDKKYPTADKQDCKKCDAGQEPDTKKQQCKDCTAGNHSSDGEKCLQCDKGTYSAARASDCTPCPAGKYSSVKGATACTPCAAGTYYPSTGAVECRPCNAGTYYSGTGATACTPCPAGKYSTGGAANCTPCPEGTYYSGTGATACTPCPAGKYSDVTGAKECKICPAGKYSSTGAANCATCPAGQTSDAGASGCRSIFTYDDFSEAKEYDWTVPKGITKIHFTIIGGGASGSAGKTLTKASNKAFTSSQTLNLTGEYEPLRGQTITVKGCGGGGASGGKSWYCQSTSGLSGWFRDYGGAGGNGGTFSTSFVVNKNATKLTITIGSGGVGGANPAPASCKVNAGSQSCKSACKDDWCHHELGCAGGNNPNGGLRGGTGGGGGGATTVTDGTTTITAGGGGGGSGGSSTGSADNNHGIGAAGSDGAGGTYGGKGGAKAHPYRTGGSGSVVWDIHDGSSGSSSHSASFSKSGYCSGAPQANAASGSPGYVEVSWNENKLQGSGGASGKCNVTTAAVTLPSGATTCKVKVGGPGVASYIKCGGTTWSSDSGSYINSASGSNGGSGFNVGCSTNTSSSAHGKGGNGSYDSTTPSGNKGFIRISNGN